MLPAEVVTELFLIPAVVPVTLTEKVQLSGDARTPPASEIVEDPSTAVIDPPDGQTVGAKPLGVETTRPAGKVSVNANPVMFSAPAPELRTKVKLVLPFKATLAPPKFFENDSEDDAPAWDIVVMNIDTQPMNRSHIQRILVLVDMLCSLA
jgi:hypothetical protein